MTVFKRIAGIYIAAGILLTFAVGAAQKRPVQTPQEKQLLDSFKGPELFRAYCATVTAKTLRVVDLWLHR